MYAHSSLQFFSSFSDRHVTYEFLVVIVAIYQEWKCALCGEIERAALVSWYCPLCSPKWEVHEHCLMQPELAAVKLASLPWKPLTPKLSVIRTVMPQHEHVVTAVHQWNWKCAICQRQSYSSVLEVCWYCKQCEWYAHLDCVPQLPPTIEELDEHEQKRVTAISLSTTSVWSKDYPSIWSPWSLQHASQRSILTSLMDTIGFEIPRPAHDYNQSKRIHHHGAATDSGRYYPRILAMLLLEYGAEPQHLIQQADRVHHSSISCEDN
jgi:ribosomal protein L37AE/L43A